MLKRLSPKKNEQEIIDANREADVLEDWLRFCEEMSCNIIFKRSHVAIGEQYPSYMELATSGCARKLILTPTERRMQEYGDDWMQYDDWL